MMILLRVWLILSWSAATPLNVDNDDIPSIDTVNGDGVDSDGLHNHALENTNRDAKHAFHGGYLNFSGTIDSSGNHAGINIGSISSIAASQESQPELQGVDGGWSNWGNYGQCSKECEGGIQTRTRTCTNPVPKNKGRTCEQQNIGNEIETRDCNLHACGCEVHVGKSTSNTISATVSEGCVCPTVVNKGNWIGDYTYSDEFRVTQDGSSLQVQRTDSDHGWGMDLSFKCNQDSLDTRSPCSFNDDLIEAPECESGSCSAHDTGVLFQWENNIIPYYYSDQTTKVADKDLIRNVMNKIEQKTCFIFRETTKDDSKDKHSLQINIQPESCTNTVSGSVAQVRGNPDGLLMNLTAHVTKENGENCRSKGLILHELMHVLGVQHTQRRSDRDKNITVVWENLPSDNNNVKNQFRICENCTLYRNIPYDCDSIMHYGTHFEGKEVIEPKDTSTCKLKTYNKLYDDAFADGSYTDWKLLDMIGNCVVCNTDTFNCSSGQQCIKPKWKCDGIEDCKDGSDEIDCETVCTDDLFKCSSGECIYPKMRCDGVPDCEDHSDEDEDECQELACENKQFFCGGKCIPPKRKCDGYRDCVNGKDEINCPGKVWRDDGRCGTKYLLDDGKPARCNPTSNWPCCSKEGWCGNTAKHCQCVGCDSYKGILNIEAVKKYTASTQDMGDKLQKLQKESEVLTISREEVKLERKMVETRMYLKDKCESENGVCESEKIDRFTEESESIFQNIQKTGKVSSDFLGSFAKQKEKLDKAAKEVRKFITDPKKLWRDDSRCGPKYKLSSGEPAQCDKTRVDGHCCSKEGWCGTGSLWCNCPECVNYAECTCSEFVDEKGFGKCQTGEETLFEGSPYCYVNWPSNCTDLVESQTNLKKWRSAEACTFSDVSGGEETGGCSFNDNTLARRFLPSGTLSAYDTTENYRWPKNKILYYFVDEHTSDADKEEVRKVMKTIESKTCFGFREKDRKNKDILKTKHILEIMIISENDCDDPCTTGGAVDQRTDGKGLVLTFDKKLTKSNGCGCKGLILHELMHVLGVAHTQKRRDRDYTITVADLKHEKKILQEQYDICVDCKLFDDIPYDCDSIMHYGTGGKEQRMVPKNNNNCTLKSRAKYLYSDFWDGSETDWNLLNRIGICKKEGNKWVRETDGSE